MFNSEQNQASHDPFMNNELSNNRKQFGSDPFGYSASSHLDWALHLSSVGYSIDISQPATADDLKNPILWMSQAHALARAASTILTSEHSFDVMPIGVRSICDRQYCAAGLMLVGYSLEISLKSMLIIKNGIDRYKEIEKTIQHHRLEQLSSFIPGFSDKDKAIFRGLTYFVYWAGRYPDPGTSRINEAEDIFVLSEKYEITAADIFELSIRVMRYVNTILDNKDMA